MNLDIRSKKESALYGVMRRLGQSLSYADRVIASFKSESVFNDRVEGVLFTHDARVPTVFDKKWVATLEGLPPVGHRAMVKITARPFLDGNGQLHFLVNNFEILPDRAPFSRSPGADGTTTGGGHVEPVKTGLNRTGEPPCVIFQLG
ncbi:hypothetical protein ACFFU8_08995 [Chromobacterium piscinae]|uniref:hypothetical protein n=1 Tax=Chromobacterium piscinae TaxID=686831 RepID=UPI001E2D5167|nr:hypothetical protein [Chromobacterium piscinae]MCD5327960.1 hypothetical protein [Chromobacterium piscinae]